MCNKIRNMRKTTMAWFVYYTFLFYRRMYYKFTRLINGTVPSRKRSILGWVTSLKIRYTLYHSHACKLNIMLQIKLCPLFWIFVHMFQFPCREIADGGLAQIWQNCVHFLWNVIPLFFWEQIIIKVRHFQNIRLRFNTCNSMLRAHSTTWNKQCQW